MKILVTGATGFLGRALVQRLVAEDGLGGEHPRVERITILGRRLPPAWDDGRLRIVQGDIREAAVRQAAIDGGVDCVFHLAGALIDKSEPDYDLGRSVNLDASLALFESLRLQARPRVVFASTIAVYGPLSKPVDDDTLPQPTLSYGTHKLMVEEYLNDATRRGFVDARSVRVPGTIPRTRLPDRAFSPAFTSNIFHAIVAGEHFESPVSPAASAWLISLKCCIDTLIHAARLAPEKLPARRNWLVPSLHTTMGEMLDAIAARRGDHVRSLVGWSPIPELEAQLGRWPPLDTRLADSLGFHHDGTVAALVQRTLDEAEAVRAR